MGQSRDPKDLDAFKTELLGFEGHMSKSLQSGAPEALKSLAEAWAGLQQMYAKLPMTVKGEIIIPPGKTVEQIYQQTQDIFEQKIQPELKKSQELKVAQSPHLQQQQKKEQGPTPDEPKYQSPKPGKPSLT